MSSRITFKSRLLAMVLFLVSIFVTFPLLAKLGIGLHGWQPVFVIVGVMTSYYFAIWPYVVRLEPWTEYQYWLPKARIAGYAIYLLIPILAIVLLLYLAAKFQFGM